MKWTKCICGALICSLLVTGCGWAIQDDESTAVSQEKESKAENPDLTDSTNIQLSEKDGYLVGTLADQLSVKIALEDLGEDSLESSTYGELAAQIQELDYQKLADALYGKEVELEHTYDEEEQSNSYMYLEKIEAEEYDDTFYYQVTGTKCLTAAFNSAFQVQTQYVFRNSAKTEQMSEYGDTTSFFEMDQDLSFLPAKEAEAAVRELLEGCGLTLSEKTEIYSLTKEDLKEAEDYLDGLELLEDRSGESLKKGTWTTEDECYFMVFRGSEEGLPLYQYRRNGSEDVLSIGTSIEAIYSAEGIRYLHIENPYQVIGENTEKQSILSMENALSKLAEMYEDILSDHENIVEQCYLCYLPSFTNEGIILQPAWYLEVKTAYDMDGELWDHWDAYYLNAVSGEWITEV